MACFSLDCVRSGRQLVYNSKIVTWRLDGAINQKTTVLGLVWDCCLDCWMFSEWVEVASMNRAEPLVLAGDRLVSGTTEVCAEV
jgi:hypothetical protein